MRTVRSKPWSEYFSTGPRPRRSLATIDASPYYTRRRINHPLLVFLFVIVGCAGFLPAFLRIVSSIFLLGLSVIVAPLGFYFISPASAAPGSERLFAPSAALALAAFLAYQYWRTRAVARGLRLKRRAPASCAEGAELEVELEVVNAGKIWADGIVLIDRFTGAARAARTAEIDGAIAPGTSRRVSQRIVCDGGMGRHRLGPLSALVCDPFGLFEFEVVEDEPWEVVVSPPPEPLPALPVRPSDGSVAYGPYQAPLSGASEIWRGIREYQRGDSLRHICWKLSSRHQHLLVKEFERSVNAEVSLIVNMDARFHAGAKERSTWELAKHAAVGVIDQQIGVGNEVQLISDGARVPFGKGARHEALLLSTLRDLQPVFGIADGGLLDRVSGLIPRGSTAIYVAPTVGRDYPGHLDKLLRLRVLNVQVMCLLVEFKPFISDAWRENNPAVALMAAEAGAERRALENTRLRLTAAGVPCYILSPDVPLAASLLRPGGAR